MWWIWPLYIVMLIIVVYVSTKLAKYVDLLEHRTKVSGAMLGGVLLAGITSLPELITSITGALINEPDMTQGNILGSNLFDIAIIGALLLFYIKKVRSAKLTKANGAFLWMCTLITALILIFVVFKVSIVIPFINVNFLSLFCIALYVLSLFTSSNDETSVSGELIEQGREATITTKQVIIRFVICAIILVIVSVVITLLSDIIADTYGLGKGLAGALFLGIATSLPEIVSSFALLRLGNFNTAMSDLVGSCLFNYMVISIADVFYFSGTVFRMDLQSVYLGSCLLGAFLFTWLYYYLKRIKPKQSVLTTVLFGIAILSTYLVFLSLSAFVK
ncbi:MAG: cation transporter [Clostridia bacterium]